MAGALALSACSQAPAPQEPIRSVKLLKVNAGAASAQSEYAGEVRARVESRLGFRVAGKLVQRPVEVGQRVVAGQLLAQLDAQDYALATQAAQAQVSAAQTQRDLAAADLKRFTELKNQGFVSGAELERRQTVLQAADATLRQAQAQSAVQTNQAQYTRLLADGPGVVVAVEAEVGQVLAVGAPVVRVARDGARDVVVAVPEDRLALLRPGLPASVRLWASDAASQANPNATAGAAALPATVREVAATADPSTRTYTVKLSVPAAAALPLGATAFARFDWPLPAAQTAVKLPTSALMRTGDAASGQTAVWVWDAASSTVQPRPVVVGGVAGNEVLIASGLQAGDEVVAAGVHVLQPGQKVTRFATQRSE